MERTLLRSRLFLSTTAEDAAEQARAYRLGLELADFCYAPRMGDPNALHEAREKMRGIDRFWLHAPFAELCPCAIDPLVREVARKRFLQTAELARKLGIRRIVVHGGFIPKVYFPQWYTEQSTRFWTDLLTELPKEMTLALENVLEPSPELLTQIAAQVDDPRFGLCLDVGHANTVGTPSVWLEPMRPWLRHVHLHDNNGAWDDHAPLGAGTIPLEALLDRLLEHCPSATYTIENQSCAASLQWLTAHGYLEEHP